jgi:fumarylacetoacetate (FAA) hydrolase
MKLATLKSNQSRDGELIVVSRDGKWGVKVPEIARNLREAIECWVALKTPLEDIYKKLNDGKLSPFPVDEEKLHSPLPRAFQWADGSAFLNHVRLVRKARGAEIPESLEKVPLMYQGGSDDFLGPRDAIPQIDFAHGTDFEAEVAVIVSDVPMGVSAEAALNYIELIMLVNDVSLRGLIPEELAAGFGFFQSKPSSAFSPFALTPDELGSAWQGGRVHLPLLVDYNGVFFGKANAKEMHFHFGELIAHAARTRNLRAGTIIGSGTVSNEDPAAGSSCIIEKRMLEKINSGQMTTPFMKVGDTVEIKMLNPKGENLFGTIHQKVVKA